MQNSDESYKGKWNKIQLIKQTRNSLAVPPGYFFAVLIKPLQPVRLFAATWDIFQERPDPETLKFKRSR